MISNGEKMTKTQNKITLTVLGESDDLQNFSVSREKLKQKTLFVSSQSPHKRTQQQKQTTEKGTDSSPETTCRVKHWTKLMSESVKTWMIQIKRSSSAFTALTQKLKYYY